MNSMTSGGSLGAIVVDSIRRFGDRPMISDDNTSLTYSELGEMVGRFGALYRSIGLSKGDGIGLLTGNRVETWAAICAAAVFGLRFTPLHPLAGEDDHVHIIGDAELRVLFFDPDKFGARAAAIRSRVEDLQIFGFGPANDSEDALAALTAVSPLELKDRAEPEDLVMLAYTGGTTGRSKGVMLPHRALSVMATIIAAEWEWPQDVHYALMTPISHAAGVNIYPVMLMGGRVRLLPGFDVTRFCEVVERENISATFLVPTLINTLIEAGDVIERYDLSSLKLVIYGAAPMSPDRLAMAIAMLGPVFLQLYGQTEAPQVLTTLRIVDHDLARPDLLGSCGRATTLTQIRLFDADMNEVGVGEPGELCVRGPLVCSGYWKQPSQTKALFKGGWLHTGDVAVQDAQGYFTIVDRIKDLIISGGFNIFPREVEDALMAHPGVASAGVVGIPDPKWGEAVKAFVVRRAGAIVEERELQEHVKAIRGAPWSPKSIEFRSKLPLTGIGKLDRKALREPYWQAANRSVS